jgi:ABC-type lipoprotein release transport system permease subunit
MRTLGASRAKLFVIILSEGIMLTLAGTLIGIALGHLTLQMIGTYQESAQARLTGLVLLKAEIICCRLGNWYICSSNSRYSSVPGKYFKNTI